jgi:hypothetical protein
VHSVKTNIQTWTFMSIAVSGCTGRTTASRPPVGGVRIRTWSGRTLGSTITRFWAWSPTTPRRPSSVYWKTRYIYIYKVTIWPFVDNCLSFFFFFLLAILLSIFLWFTAFKCSFGIYKFYFKCCLNRRLVCCVLWTWI